MGLLGREARVAANDNKRVELGWRVFGFGIIALAAVNLFWGNFDSGQPVPKWFPERTALAYVTAVFLLVAGIGIGWRKTVTWAAAALIAYYGLVVLVLMNGRVIFKNYAVYGAYFGVAEPVAIAAGALIVYAATADMDAARAARLTRAAQLAFGVCAVFFGGAHFVYMSLTAPLVPTWLPPSQEFWGYATGVFQIAGGIAILTGIRARLAAILLTVMYASFTPLVHLPTLFTGHTTQFVWTENAVNIILTGVAWIVAGSLRRR
jgi:uncharacterized membrane protein